MSDAVGWPYFTSFIKQILKKNQKCKCSVHLLWVLGRRVVDSNITLFLEIVEMISEELVIILMCEDGEDFVMLFVGSI